MFTLYYTSKDGSIDRTLSLPCTQEAYNEVCRAVGNTQPYELDFDDYDYSGVCDSDDISKLNALAKLDEEYNDGSDNWNGYIEFIEDECDSVDEWLNALGQYNDVGFDSDIGEDTYYFSSYGAIYRDDYSDYYRYDVPDDLELDKPPMYEPLDLRDREVLKDLFARTVYKDSDPKIVGFIVGCYINEDPTKCTVRIMGVDYTAEELMEWKDFYTEKPIAREITE